MKNKSSKLLKRQKGSKDEESKALLKYEGGDMDKDMDKEDMMEKKS